MDRRRTGPLRRWIAIPLAATFVLLWLGTMTLFTQWRCQRLEDDVYTAYRNARDELDEQLEYYQNNLNNGLGAEAAAILRNNLSSAALYLSDLDGGMALVVRDGAGAVIRSQLAWGYGHENGVDVGERWYLELDSGLDDTGQTALAEWMMAHRKGAGYSLYPPDSAAGGDGTYARLTGWVEEGNTLRVKRIELIHPDGSTELVVETRLEGEPTDTVTLRHLELRSALMPSWYWSDNTGGENGPTDMSRRLANIREAQAILDRELAGEDRTVLRDGGFAGGGYSAETGELYYVAVQCGVLIPALRENLPLYASTLFLMVLVLLGLTRYLSRRVTKPVEELSARAEAGEPCPEDGPIRELNTLATAVNAGRGRLEEQLRRERAFTRAAAHELKTPLAVLRTHAEALREDIAPARRGEYLDVVLDESDRMAALVGSLLELSHMEEGGGLHREVLAMDALVRAVFDRLALPLERKGLHLKLNLEPGQVFGDRARLESAVENLASNALRYTPEGGAVSVRLERAGSWLRLAVDNDGPGLTTRELAHLFEPFYRGDAARSRATGGTGLGLAIVRTAAAAHGGTCWAENRAGGVRIWMELPALQSV